MRGTSGIGRIAAAISGALWLGATSAGAADDVGRPLPDPVAVDVPAAAEPAPQPDPEIEAAARRVADEAAIAQVPVVAARLATRAPRELYPYFDLYLYVSKAARGLWAQRMFVFRKDETNTLVFEETFAVSTGRERHEQYFTWTPPGIFALDPNRFYRITYSAKWRNAAMPWAMFLDYSYRTKMSGVALHAATRGLVKNLGKRASGGCVRLPPDRAESLFGRIQANFPSTKTRARRIGKAVSRAIRAMRPCSNRVTGFFLLWMILAAPRLPPPWRTPPGLELSSRLKTIGLTAICAKTGRISRP